MAAPSLWFEGFPDQITAEDYAALPEEFGKTIEVIDGHVVKCESPSRVHNRVALNLAIAFKAGRKPCPYHPRAVGGHEVRGRRSPAFRPLPGKDLGTGNAASAALHGYEPHGY